MGKHSAPVSSDTNLQTAQFGKHRSVFSTNNPGMATRVKQDMQRRQGLSVGAHAKPGKHAKPYDPHKDIAESASKKGYRAKHDMTGRAVPAKGKVFKYSSDKKSSKSGRPSHLRETLRHISKHEGKNKEHLKAMVH